MVERYNVKDDNSDQQKTDEVITFTGKPIKII